MQIKYVGTWGEGGGGYYKFSSQCAEDGAAMGDEGRGYSISVSPSHDRYVMYKALVECFSRGILYLTVGCHPAKAECSLSRTIISLVSILIRYLEFSTVLNLYGTPNKPHVSGSL